MECPHCSKKRSAPDHRRLMAIIGNAFKQWPEAHPFQPDDEEELRAYLICKAGFSMKTPIALPDPLTPPHIAAFQASIAAGIKAANGFAFVIPDRSGVRVVAPKSMKFAKMSQRDFAQLRDNITDILEATLGCKVDELTKEAA